MKTNSTIKKMVALVLLLITAGVFGLYPLDSLKAQQIPASLFLSPSGGTFQVDSTFDVGIYLNTNGQTINTVDLALRFPADKLQLVSSGTGKSIIGLWTNLPKYDNQTGTLSLTGGVPGGVKVDRGLITNLTFRVKAVGGAIVKFEKTRLLLNDGLGTEALVQSQNSIYDLVLPAPAGPVVVSDTHPDQTRWYRSSSANLRWGVEAGADAFSYVLSEDPVEIPDDISEGARREISYKNLSDGRKYFHIRALRNGQWGGTTHYALNVDTSPPAEFKIEIVPGTRTSRKQPVIQFDTTDAYSGTDHFELKLVPLRGPDLGIPEDDQIFIEARSPYIPEELADNTYDVIVRAYDNAGNYRESTERLHIVPVVLRFLGSDGLEFKSSTVIPWWVVFLIIAIIIVALAVLGRRMRQWHKSIDRQRSLGQLPNNLQSQMEELQRYKAKYGNIAVIMLFVLGSIFTGTFSNAQSQNINSIEESQSADVFDAPLITTISKNITNEDIFYIGGKSGTKNAEVILYIQNLQTAETVSETIKSDDDGDWFYRHDTFLPKGRYVMWAQSKAGGQTSPPSPQVQIEVEETAIQLGATRISHATLYLVLFIASLLVLVSLAVYIIYHSRHGRRKHSLMLKEISEAQESLRRGFAVLNRDIQAELAVIKKAKLSKSLSEEEARKEEQLLKDLSDIEQYITKEVWDIENAAHN